MADASAALDDRVGYWQREAGASDRFASTPLPAAVDVVVIGGGLAGLTTALEVRTLAPGATILVLEAARVGHGASGRNAGFLSPLAAPIWMLGATRSRELAWAAAHLGADLHRAARWLAADVPGAELAPAGLGLQAQGRASDAALGEFASAIATTGLPHTLGPSAVRAPWRVLAMPAYTVQPVRLIDGLAQLAVQRGVLVRERAPVLALTHDVAGVRVRLRDHTVLHARRVIVCTNAYAGAFADPRALLGRVAALPMHAFMAATVPAPAATLAAAARDGDFTVELSPLQAYHRRHAGRIIYGAIDQLRAPAGGDGAVPAPTVARLHVAMRRSVGAAPAIEHAWSGAFHATPTGLPIIRASTAHPDVILNVGYGGTGVALTLACAPLAAGLALGRFRTDDDARLLAAIHATRPSAVDAALALGRIARALVTRSA